MLQTTIQNFLHFESGTIEAAPLAIVAGRNMQGKTSGRLAIAAALSGQVIPIDCDKKDAKKLVTAGAEYAVVEVANEQGGARVVYPDCNRTASGIFASEYAVGLKSLLTLPAKERAPEILKLLKAEPTIDDLKTATGLSGDMLEKLWQKIKAVGFDKAHSDAADKGKIDKNRWLQITAKQRYPDKNALAWLPANWSPEFGSVSVEGINESLQEASQQLEKAIAAEAIGGKEREELVEKFSQYEKRRADAEQARQKETAARNAYKIACDAQAATKRENIAPCPHCGEDVAIFGNVLKAPNAQPAKKPENAEADVKRLKQALDEAERERMTAEAASFAAGQAGKKLAEMEGKPAAVEGAVDACRAEVAKVQATLAAVKAKADADAIAKSVETNQKIVDGLAPEGIRREKLAVALVEFNKTLEALANAAGWSPVALSKELKPTIPDGFAHHAESQLWHVRVLLQVAVAQLDGSQAILVDAADILDKPRRVGLLRLLVGAGMPAIIFYTANDPSELPDLAARKLGNTYWIEGGVCTLVNGVTAPPPAVSAVN